MNGYTCSLKQFLKDTSEHEFTRLKDDGVYRHLRFSKPGSSVYRFDIITWPGYLAIAGDCGDYVFSRLEDMFDFFRSGIRDEGFRINPGYWGEKCRSVNSQSGLKTYCTETAKKNLREALEYSYPDDDERIDKFMSKVPFDDGQHEFYRYLYHEAGDPYNHDEGDLVPQFDCEMPACERWDYHFIWCLFAIVQGISIYDSLQSKAA